MGDKPDYERTVPPQPAPEGAISAHDMVISDLMAWHEAELTGPAVNVMTERKVWGLEKYKVILHKDNGRPHDQDAEDEVADFVVYLRNWIDSRPELREILFPIYRDTLWALVTVSSLRVTGAAPPYLGKMQAQITRLHGEPFCGAWMVGGAMCDEPLDEFERCRIHGDRALVMPSGEPG